LEGGPWGGGPVDSKEETCGRQKEPKSPPTRQGNSKRERSRPSGGVSQSVKGCAGYGAAR